MRESGATPELWQAPAAAAVIAATCTTELGAGLPGSSSSPAQQEMQPGTARGVWMVRVVAEGWQMRCDSPDTSCPSAPMVRAGCSSRRRWTGCCPAMSPGTIINSCYSCHQKASRIFAILRPCRMVLFPLGTSWHFAEAAGPFERCRAELPNLQLWGSRSPGNSSGL